MKGLFLFFCLLCFPLSAFGEEVDYLKFKENQEIYQPRLCGKKCYVDVREYSPSDRQRYGNNAFNLLWTDIVIKFNTIIDPRTLKVYFKTSKKNIRGDIRCYNRDAAIYDKEGEDQDSFKNSKVDVGWGLCYKSNKKLSTDDLIKCFETIPENYAKDDGEYHYYNIVWYHYELVNHNSCIITPHELLPYNEDIYVYIAKGLKTFKDNSKEQNEKYITHFKIDYDYISALELKESRKNKFTYSENQISKHYIYIDPNIENNIYYLLNDKKKIKAIIKDWGDPEIKREIKNFKIGREGEPPCQIYYSGCSEDDPPRSGYLVMPASKLPKGEKIKLIADNIKIRNVKGGKLPDVVIDEFVIDE